MVVFKKYISETLGLYMHSSCNTMHISSIELYENTQYSSDLSLSNERKNPLYFLTLIYKF